ncbi:MAG: hypothetical protein KatS3mg089_0278 [Patescibacteria group bacterium]|nr:MAG: hypothetical protein KatS3mg089_0278 [Patescibacteria group bacterium]
MNRQTDGFDPGDDEKVIALLKKWKGGTLSDALFTRLAWMLPQPTVEMVIIRKRDKTLEVLLIPRPPDDIVWPGFLHLPGQTLRRMDYFRDDNTPMNGPLERIQKYEIQTSYLRTPEFVGVAQYMTQRGPEAVHIYLGAIAKNAKLPSGAIWAAIDDLPKMRNFINHQIIPIKIAANYFINHYTK